MGYLDAMDDMFDDPDATSVEVLLNVNPGYQPLILWGGKWYRFKSVADARKAGFQI